MQQVQLGKAELTRTDLRARSRGVSLQSIRRRRWRRRAHSARAEIPLTRIKGGRLFPSYHPLPGETKLKSDYPTPTVALFEHDLISLEDRNLPDEEEEEEEEKDDDDDNERGDANKGLSRDEFTPFRPCDLSSPFISCLQHTHAPTDCKRFALFAFYLRVTLRAISRVGIRDSSCASRNYSSSASEPVSRESNLRFSRKSRSRSNAHAVSGSARRHVGANIVW